jgi:Ca-activated chloride channel family protein
MQTIGITSLPADVIPVNHSLDSIEPLASPMKYLRCMRHVALPGALALLLTSVPLVGQVASPAPARPEPQATFKSGVEVVTVSVAIRDDEGKVIQNLTKADFEVFDSGRKQEIRDFFVGDSPVSLAILLDISGSMAVGGNMDRAREAVAVATMNLHSEKDEAALFTFDSELREVVAFTTDTRTIHKVSLRGKPWGQTSLYDAVGQAAKAVSERANKHRALLVISDGVDTASKMTPAEVSGIASAIDVPVYLLRVVNPLDHPGGELEVIETDGRRVQAANLADLARWTGGDIRVASVPAHTSAAIQDLFTELRHQYLITFEPGTRPGWHPLEIRTRKKSLVVHARGGYMVGPKRSGS